MARELTAWGSGVGTGAGALDVVILDIPVGREFTEDEIAAEVRRRGLKVRGAVREHLVNRQLKGFVVKTDNGWQRVSGQDRLSTAFGGRRARGMKIGCHCGASIIDQTDDLPHKGHLIPDQAWLATCDAMDNEVIDPMADGRLDREAAYQHARQIIGRSARLMWQCRACGRLYIDGRDGQLRCFVPESEPADLEILRGDVDKNLP